MTAATLRQDATVTPVPNLFDRCKKDICTLAVCSTIYGASLVSCFTNVASKLDAGFLVEGLGVGIIGVALARSNLKRKLGASSSPTNG